MEASAATVHLTTSSFQTRSAAKPIQVSDHGAYDVDFAGCAESVYSLFLITSVICLA